ncbi:MAG: tetratricopeptide repeat protein [Deltaproteobacteria bacterium]|nr:tetratricopeptide repeat protein [Deltaproteobacteria bacterium]
MKEKMKSILVNGVVIIVISLFLFLAGTWWRMSAQFSLGQEALRKGDFPGAVAGFESALHMYIPFHPTIKKAAEQLWLIGENNERAGNVTRALIAYRALRSSFYADHWLVTPGEEWIARCDKKIAALIPMQRER